MAKPFRFPWNNFPDVVIHAEELFVKNHPMYKDAKTGDPDSAWDLVKECVSEKAVLTMESAFAEPATPTLISVHAEESAGLNAIPAIMADYLSHILQWRVERFVVQANIVNHTGSSGFSRLAKQAIFKGDRTYFVKRWICCWSDGTHR